MSFFARTRTRRHTAFVVLLVWLFALASSLANACFLEARGPHATAAKPSQAATIQVPAVLHAQMDANAEHHDDPDGSKKSCLKVCDDGTHTLPQMQSSVDYSDPGPATQVATLWTGSPHVASAPRRVGDLTLPIVGPPLRVRYSRLAL